MATREYPCDKCKHAVLPDQVDKHFDNHCIRGEHCTSVDADCAAAVRVDDHSIECCNCGGIITEENLLDAP